MRPRQTVSLFVLSLALLLAVFAASRQADAQEFVYTSNFGDGTISGFGLDPANGTIAAVPGSPFGAGVGPVPLAATPDGKYLYDVILNWYRGGPCGTNFSQLLAYRIEPNGRLLPLQEVPLTGFCASYALVDPAGQFVYVALTNFGGNKYGEIAAYKINAGTLTEVPGSPFPSPIVLPSGQGAAIGTLAISHDGRTLFGTDPWDAAGILVFDRNPNTGVLLYRNSFNSGTPFGPMAMTQSGKFLLAIPTSGDEIYEYAIGATDGLTEVPGSPFPGTNANFANGIAVSPNGNFIAIAEVGGVSIERVTPSNGHLSLVAGSPFGGGTPAAVTFDSTGHFVITPGTVFEIDPQTGILTQGSTFQPGSAPEAIVAVKLSVKN